MLSLVSNLPQITLPGVLHSINAPTRWYGSEEIIDLWHGKVAGMKKKVLF